MKKFLIVAAVLTLAAPFGGIAPAFADSSTDRLCAPGAPEGYKRPGGYCDQIDSKGSLHEDKGCDYRILETMIVPVAFAHGESLLVADNCYPVVDKV